jgi:flagellar protein FliO/FliZ
MSGLLRLKAAVASAAALSFVTIAAAAAADDNKIIFPGGATQSAAPTGSGGSMANVLTLVVALILAAVGGWLFWRNRRAQGSAPMGRSLAVEETKSLGNRQYLVVASYEGRKFLLGVCPGRIDMLAPLDGAAKGKES